MTYLPSRESGAHTSIALRVPVAEAESRLGERIQLGRKLVEVDIPSKATLEDRQDEFGKWSDYNAELLERLFTTTRIRQEYEQFAGVAVGGPVVLLEAISDFRREVLGKIRRLESVRDRLELFHDPAEREGHGEGISGATPSSSRRTREVFIIHGHDEAAKSSVARLLERLSIKPIILHEQPDKSQTIVEKFEANSDVDFAVAIFTPDDFGGAMIDIKRDSASYARRARQNVLLETGYFHGKLGRGRVAVLYAEGVELPSDYSGVLYILLDSAGAWRLKLATELRAAGIEIDMNLL